MSDYSWIKPDVKAEIIGGVYPEIIGEIVTIKTLPYDFENVEYLREKVVQIHEGKELAIKLGCPQSELLPACNHLRKIDDDKPSEYWEEMAGKTNLIGKEIKIEELA